MQSHQVGRCKYQQCSHVADLFTNFKKVSLRFPLFQDGLIARLKSLDNVLDMLKGLIAGSPTTDDRRPDSVKERKKSGKKVEQKSFW